MNIRTLLTAAVLGFAVLGTAQSTKNIEDKLKVHPRRLAFNNKDGRHQPRLLGKKDRHKTRAAVRTVTHKVTTPHKPKG